MHDQFRVIPIAIFVVAFLLKKEKQKTENKTRKNEKNVQKRKNIKKKYFLSKSPHTQFCKHALVYLCKIVSLKDYEMIKAARAARKLFIQMAKQWSLKICIFRQIVPPIFYEIIKTARAARKMFQYIIHFLTDCLRKRARAARKLFQI